MKKIWIVIVASAGLFAACGNNSENSYSEKDTTATIVPESSVTATPVTPDYNAPDNVRVAFQNKYPTASDVTWSPYKMYDRINWEWTGWPSMDTSYYAVNYTAENRKHISFWDKLGKWIGTSSTIEDSTMLPDPVKKTVSNNYKGYRITSIDEENDKNKTVYEIKLEKGDAHARILVDKNGKILRKDTKA
jgi:hypothetical protein